MRNVFKSVLYSLFFTGTVDPFKMFKLALVTLVATLTVKQLSLKFVARHRYLWTYLLLMYQVSQAFALMKNYGTVINQH